MINIIVEPALLLGAIFAVVMILLYGLRFINPDLSTDWDIFITTLGIVYSSILIIHGWRLDPILLFSQVLINSILLPTCWENIRLRAIAHAFKKLKHFINQIINKLNLEKTLFIVNKSFDKLMKKLLAELNIPQTDPKFVKLRELLKNNLGYMGQFTKWYIKDREDWGKIEDTFRELKSKRIDKPIECLKTGWLVFLYA
jgi:hypothetical protein